MSCTSIGSPSPSRTVELLLQRNDRAAVVHADARDRSTHPGVRPEVQRLLDFSEPVGLFMLLLLHFMPDAWDPAAVVAGYRDVLPSGSYIAVSHVAADGDARNLGDAVKVYDQNTHNQPFPAPTTRCCASSTASTWSSRAWSAAPCGGPTAWAASPTIRPSTPCRTPAWAGSPSVARRKLFDVREERPNVAFGALNAPKAALGAFNATKATLGRSGTGPLSLNFGRATLAHRSENVDTFTGPSNVRYTSCRPLAFASAAVTVVYAYRSPVDDTGTVPSTPTGR